jgi:hypothetical protein
MSVKIRSGGGGTSGPAGFSDSFSLQINASDISSVPTDDSTFVINLSLSDDVAEQSETVTLAFPSPDFADTSDLPTDGNVFTVRVWLASSSGTGTTNPTNADGMNDAAVATLQTVALGTNPITLTSTIGANVPAVTVTAVTYRGWFKSVNTLATSTGTLIMHSTTGLFTDITMFTNSATNTTINHLGGTFSFDLFAAGVNTLAKLQSCQMLHRVSDTVAGISPHVLTVDAGAIDITGAFV